MAVPKYYNLHRSMRIICYLVFDGLMPHYGDIGDLIDKYMGINHELFRMD